MKKTNVKKFLSKLKIMKNMGRENAFLIKTETDTMGMDITKIFALAM